MFARRFGIIVLAAFFVAAGTLLHGAEPTVKTLKSAIQSPGEPSVFDLDLDGRYEILLSGTDGVVGVYDIVTRKPWWESKVGDKSLTLPVAGNFDGSGMPIIGVGTLDGTVVFVRAADGLELGRYKCPHPLAVAPSVVPSVKRGALERDFIVVCDDAGDVRCLSLDDGKIVEEFALPNTYNSFSVGRITQPASVGDITGDGVPEIVIGTVSGTVQAVSVNDTSRRHLWHAPQGVAISSVVTLVDLQNSGRRNLVFGVSSGIGHSDGGGADGPTVAGNLIILAFDEKPGTNVSFKTVQFQKLLGTPRAHVLAADLDQDGYVDLAGSSQNVVAAYDGATQFASFGQHAYSTTSYPTPISLVRLADGKQKILFGELQGGFYLLDASLKDMKPERLETNLPVDTMCPAGDLSGRGKLDIVFAPKGDGTVRIVQTDIDLEAGNEPVMATGANFQRDGEWTSASVARLRAMRDRSARARENLLLLASEAKDAGNYKEALGLVKQAMLISPHDSKSRSLLSSIEWRRHWLRRSLGIVVVLLIGGWAARLGGRYVLARKRLRHAERMSAEGNHLQAAREYRQLLLRDPQNRRILLALARCYIESGELFEESADVLERAHALEPDNTQFSLALANAYAAERRETPDALDVYLIALGVLEEGRGRIAYLAANILRARNDQDQALRYYKLATREGFNEPEVYRKMAAIFLESGQFSEKTLPVFETVVSAGEEDPRLLEGLCRSYAAARRVDDKARRACSQLLVLRPDSLVALRLLAKCCLHAGNSVQSIDFAERAHAVAPEDAETIEVLAGAYVLERRTDDKAVELYRKAVAHDPDKPDLMRMLAMCLLEHGDASAESFGIIRQASDMNPQDIDLLAGLARSAESLGDHPAVIAALEKVVALGSESPSIYGQMARAYLACGDFSAGTERSYREALRTAPEDRAMLGALARVLVAADRTDADAMTILEKAFAGASQDVAVARHLAKAYTKNARYDEAIKLARWLLQQAPEDEEVQKLFAHASLHSNKLEEAIRQYEHLVETHPGDREAVVNLAVAYAQKQRVDNIAAALYEKALEFEPGNAWVRVAFARHHAGGGRYARAVEEFRQALAAEPKAANRICEELRALIASAPERVDVRWFLANVLIERGNLKEAMEQLQAIFENDPSQLKNVLQAYDRILAKDPSSLHANLHMGVLLKVQGRFEEARDYLERAYKINPANSDVAGELEDLYGLLLREDDDVAVRFELGRLCYQQQDYDKAIGHFQKTCQDFRYENESIKMLGLCFVGKGMLEFALQEFRKLVIDEEMKGILYDLAQRYEAKNDLVGAKQVYRQLFAADINYKNVKSKFEMLAGSTSDPMTLERTSLMTQLSEKAQRRYELLEELGRGAMGIVYKAKDNELDEVVALKIMPDNLSHNPEAVQRFKSEARSARRLAHPNIVRIHDIGEEMGRKYISMEFVDGTDLKRLLRADGKLPVPEVARLAIEIAKALDYAHSMGIVHRDIKPANIMLNEQRHVKVSDFGIAKILESTRSETAAGAIIGTPLYMSPEQIHGQPIDNRSDIYSLGIMLYELANGQPPFTEGDLAYQHSRVAPPPLPAAPPALADAIMKCLEKDREARWRNAGELVQALEKSGLAG